MGTPRGRAGAAMRVAAHGGKRGNGTSLLLFGGADAEGNVFEDTWLLHVEASMPDGQASTGMGIGMGAQSMVRWEHVSGALAPSSGGDAGEHELSSGGTEWPVGRAFPSVSTVWTGAGASSEHGVATGVVLYGGVVVQPDL